MKIDKKIDLKGEVCPITFVKTKMALDDLNSGEILEVIIDFKPAFTLVPVSCQNLGHTIIHKEQINNSDFRLIIKKK